MITLTQTKLTDNILSHNAEGALPFSSAADESRLLAPQRQAISESYSVVMAVLAQANAPDSVRNFIDALINLSGGEARIEANDYRIGSAFYKDEERRNRLKKKVQAWRKGLHKWQTASGYTLVQMRSGFKISETKNQPSVYRLIVLELAAKVLAMGDTDIESAARSVLSEACGIPSKVDDGRRRAKHTSESCRKMALSWLDKSLDMARTEGYLNEAISELGESLKILLDEYKTGGASESKSAHLAGQDERNLGSISTTIIPITTNKDDVVVNKPTQLTSASCDESTTRNNFASESISVEAVSVTKLDRALDHARRGFRVFPVHVTRANGCSCWQGANCPTPAKHPRILGWRDAATTDEKVIRAWWMRFPKANVGIATGAGSGIVVIDIDTKGDGFASLSKLQSEHGTLPETLTARTGSGGQHILFKCPDGIEIRNLQASQKLGRGLDVRGDGGFIVAAGSIHESGNGYEWIDENAQIAEMPAWLIEKLTAPAPVQSEVCAIGARVQARARAVEGFPTIYESGDVGRNNFLFSKAAGLVRSHDYTEALKRVSWWNERCCVPPIDINELEKLVKHAHKNYSWR